MGEAVTNGDTWQWTPKKEAVAFALAEGKSYRTVASELSVGVTTITRWMKVPEFQSRIDEHHDDIIAEARRILRRNAAAAALQLVNIVGHGHTLHGVKLAAVKDLLDRVGFKPSEKHEVGGKIEIEYVNDWRNQS